MRARTFLAFLCALLLTGVAFAQEQRGSIEGVVKDTSGAVLPGVTVEARSATGAVATATSDATGTYRFPSLLPGTYTVSANLSGFTAAKVENVEILLGQIKKVDFAMAVAGVAETVQVTGESPLIDVKQSARATSIRADQIDLLPKGRDFMTVVTQAPGANNEAKSGGVMIDGATTGENRYIVDGAETTNIVNGGSGKALIADFIEEVQVKSSGYTAEYGGATGGVINVVTKSGTNNFRGNALFYMESSGLRGATITENTNPQTLRLSPTNSDAAETITYPGDKYSRYEPGFSIGGPIAKDKTWFFVAYQPTIKQFERTVTLRADGSTITQTSKRPETYFSANNTAQLGSKLRTRVAYNNGWSKTDGALPALDGSNAPGTNFAYGNKYPNWSLSGQADWILKQNFFVGARVGYYTSDNNSFGIPTDPRYLFVTTNVGMPGVPADLQRVTAFSTPPTNTATTFDKQQRLAFQVDGTAYGNFAGQHTIKGGFQMDRLANDVLSGEQGNLVRLYWGRSFNTGTQLLRGAYGYYRVRSNGAVPKQGFITQGAVSTNNYGLFIQDAWTINNKLTVNLGLRTEDEKVPAYTSGEGIPTYGIKFSFKDKLAPRLGFAYDVKGDGRWKAYGSWGIFYDIFKMNLARGSFGGEKWLEYWYTLDTPNWTNLVDGANCPPTCAGTQIWGPVDYRHPSFGADAIDPDLKPMKSEEASFGMEHQLSNVTAVSVRYLRKWLDRAVDDTGSLDANFNEIYVIANPGFGSTSWAWSDPKTPLPKAKRNYDSVEFAFVKNMSNNWYFRGSYMWSRLYGNYSGLDQTDENGRQSPNTGRLYDYPLMSFDQHGYPVNGVLATDRPHQGKVQFIYNLPFGTSLGINEYIASGIPRTREIAVISSSGYPMFYMGRNSDGRMPTFSQTDLYVQHQFKMAGSRSIALSLNVLNVFNQQTATNYFQTENASGYTLNFSEADFYAHALDFNTLKQQQGMKTDPRFLASSGWQTPINARIGVKFLF